MGELYQDLVRRERDEAKFEERVTTAKRMLQMGVALNDVIFATQMSKEEVLRIRKELNL